MKKIITAITNDYGPEKQALTIIVDIKNPDQKPHNYAEQALRAVANDYANTTSGFLFLKATNGAFNYGDLVNAPIPDSIWNKYDIAIIDTFVSDICVDHDDQLIKTEA